MLARGHERVIRASFVAVFFFFNYSVRVFFRFVSVFFSLVFRRSNARVVRLQTSKSRCARRRPIVMNRKTGFIHNIMDRDERGRLRTRRSYVAPAFGEYMSIIIIVTSERARAGPWGGRTVAGPRGSRPYWCRQPAPATNEKGTKLN